MDLPKLASRAVAFAIACVPALRPMPSLAQEPAAAVAPAPVDPTLRTAVEDFWHYAKIARYELATAAGEQVLAADATPRAVLEAFEAVSSQRKDNLDQWMIRWSGVDGLKDITARLQEKLAAGHIARRSDPVYIKENIDRLNVNERAYALAVGRLRQSGELAIPFMIDYLRSPEKAPWHTAIRRALRDLGRSALNPLVAATEMKDNDTLIAVVTALGDLGYDAAGPYLARLAAADDTAGTVREAARQALGKLGVSGDPADLFTALAEQLYYDRSAITVDQRVPAAFVWYWSNDRGLYKADVPPAIFNEIMAMRAAEFALKLGGGKGDALPLWLGANYQREVELPSGQRDPTRAPNQPDAHYYGVSAGAQYLNAALARALRDGKSAVALKIIRSLHEIAGQSNFMAAGTAPLVTALAYPDRLVRFEAAFALAQALPQQPFEGSERVVPLLAEAIAQTGVPSALLVMPTQDEVNSLAEGMKGTGGLVAAGATTAEAAVAAGQSMPAVDVIIVSEDLGAGEVDKLFALAGGNPKLAGAAKLIVTRTPASPYELRKQTDPLLSTTQSRDAQSIAAAMIEARKKAGALPTDPEIATQYATRAAELLQRLAISRGQVMDVALARQSLLQSLHDDRPEIVKLVGQTLALINAPDAQSGLLDRALADGVADDVKISLLKSLATSARFFGNTLEPSRISSLAALVADSENLEIRSAAAEAHGALNLPADQARKLIVDQMRV